MISVTGKYGGPDEKRQQDVHQAVRHDANRRVLAVLAYLDGRSE
jgi:hypothetical protein